MRAPLKSRPIAASDVMAMAACDQEETTAALALRLANTCEEYVRVLLEYHKAMIADIGRAAREIEIRASGARDERD